MVDTEARVAESAHLFRRGADLRLREGARLRDVAGAERSGAEQEIARRVDSTHPHPRRHTCSRRSQLNLVFVLLDNRAPLIRTRGHLRNRPILSRVWNVPRIPLLTVAWNYLLIKTRGGVVCQSQIGGRRFTDGATRKKNVMFLSNFFFIAQLLFSIVNISSNEKVFPPKDLTVARSTASRRLNEKSMR